MSCPRCQSESVLKRKVRTGLGYQIYYCRACRRRFNQRTGTPFNDLQFPTDIVLMAVLWRLRYKLGFRDVTELLLQRGFTVSHETIRIWEYRFAPLVSESLRRRRRGRAGRSWYLDETYVKVSGRWCYLYRAIDREGNLLDSSLSEKRRSSSVPSTSSRYYCTKTSAPDHGQASRVHEGYSLDRRTQGLAPTQPVSEQPDGAESSTHQAALLPDAWLRKIRVGKSILHRVRRVTKLPEDSESPRQPGHSVGKAGDLQDKMVNSYGRPGCLIAVRCPRSTRP